MVITLETILDKNTLDIQPGSFIPNERSDRGVRILAITLAFQAREAGSIPARRSNFSPFWVVDRYDQRALERTCASIVK